MEEDLKKNGRPQKKNGRRPQTNDKKWKTTSKKMKMVDTLNFLKNQKRPKFLFK